MSSVAFKDTSIDPDTAAAAAEADSTTGAVVSRIMSSEYVFVVSATPLKRTYTTLV